MTRDFVPFAVLAAVLLVAVGLSGCMSVQATAQDVQPDADAVAAAWDAEAALVMVFGVEATMDVRSMLAASGGASWQEGAMGELTREEHWERVQRDPRPGNGHAELWAYVYRSGDGERHVAILMDKEGSLVTTVEEEGLGPSNPVGDYVVDSDAAMRLAKEASPALARALEGDSFGVVLVLFREDAERDPVWLVAGGGGMMLNAGGGMVVIDAMTAVVLMSDSGAGMGFDW